MKAVNIPTSLCVTAFFIFMLTQACSPVEVKHPSPAINIVKKGEKFRIILPENHSESFMWKLDQNKKNAVDYLNAVWHGDEKGIYYHFEAMRPGQDTLNFALYKFNEVNRYTSYIVKVE
jgi:predicted secreted protein